MPAKQIHRFNDKIRRDAINDRINVLERLVREEGTRKRSIADTVHHVVKMLTGREPVYESTIDLSLPPKSAEFHKLREQTRRNKLAAAIDKLKTYIRENNLRESSVCEKLDRLGVVNCIIDHIREKFGSDGVKQEPTESEAPQVDDTDLQENTPMPSTSTVGTIALQHNTTLPLITPSPLFSVEQHVILSRILSPAEYLKLFAAYPVQLFTTQTPDVKTEETEDESI